MRSPNEREPTAQIFALGVNHLKDLFGIAQRYLMQAKLAGNLDMVHSEIFYKTHSPFLVLRPGHGQSTFLDHLLMD